MLLSMRLFRCAKFSFILYIPRFVYVYGFLNSWNPIIILISIFLNRFDQNITLSRQSRYRHYSLFAFFNLGYILVGAMFGTHISRGWSNRRYRGMWLPTYKLCVYSIIREFLSRPWRGLLYLLIPGRPALVVWQYRHYPIVERELWLHGWVLRY